jgi:predicted chitinase
MSRKISLLYSPNFDVFKKDVIIGPGDLQGYRDNSFRSGKHIAPLSAKKEALHRDTEASSVLSSTSNHKVITTGSWNNFSTEETLSDRQVVEVGDTKVTVTDPYAVRTMESREGKHSTGIDIKTSTGNAIALSDGVIESVKLQGNGDVISPSEGAAAGYYVTVKNDDGSRTQYMHLDPMNDTDIKSLEGKKLKRGETIWGYLTGSGSITGPHIKVRHYGDNSKFNIDPSNLIMGKTYSFIPDRNGNNILSNKNYIKYNNTSTESKTPASAEYSPDARYFTTNSTGSTYQSTKKMQAELVASGYNIGSYRNGEPLIDGIYGPKTKKAFEKYTETKKLQQHLVAFGYDIGVDSENNPLIDGILGEKTRKAADMLDKNIKPRGGNTFKHYAAGFEQETPKTETPTAEVGSFIEKINQAAARRNLNNNQIKALYVLNGVEDKSGSATESAYYSVKGIYKTFGGKSKEKTSLALYAKSQGWYDPEGNIIGESVLVDGVRVSKNLDDWIKSVATSHSKDGYGNRINSKDLINKKQEELFNVVYADRHGRHLDNDKVGDGWKYRGRGGVQLTGKSNYQKITNILNKNGVDIDLVKNPELAADPRYSAEILVAFAEKEGMFNKKSRKYLSESDYQLIAQLDPNAIDKLHNITNANADNDRMTKIAKKVYGV